MTNTKPMIWSPQQQAFLDWCVNGKGSAVLEARAGTGKTTTLVEAARRIRGQVALVAYNTKIGKELKGKLAAAGLDWKKAQGGTVHSFCFAAWRKAQGDVRVEEFKVRDLVDAMLPNGREPGTTAHPLAVFASTIVQLVSLARQTAIGISGGPVNDVHTWLEMADHFDTFDEDEGPISSERKVEVIQLAQKILEQSSSMLDVIDFDDMIYLPLLYKVRFWQFDVVMVDEAQDTNTSRRMAARAMLKRGGRLIAVGDRHQAIYGFTGADADALDLIAQEHNCINLPLTVSYRCPKSVIAYAQQWVEDIQAHPEAAEGEVSHSTMEDFFKRNDLNGNAAVLSRTNKPLVALAFTLIRKRIPCKIEGRDVAARIKKLIQRWKVETLDELEDKLDAYLARETTKLLAAKKEQKLAEIEDAVETVRVIVDQCRSEGLHTISDAVAYVDSMFGDDVKGMLTLSSIHKSKGREWHNVFWLDRAGTCPNKWARQAWQQVQERNLMYVAATRAQQKLIELEPMPKEG